MRNIKYATCCLAVTMLVGCATQSAEIVGNQRYETMEVATTAEQESVKETEEETYTVVPETTASTAALETTAIAMEETKQKVTRFRIYDLDGVDYVPELASESSLIDMPGCIVWRAGVEYPTNAIYKLNYVLNNNEEGITIDRENSAIYVDTIDYGITDTIYHLNVRTASNNWELEDVTLTTAEEIDVVEHVYRDFSNMYVENPDYDFNL